MQNIFLNLPTKSIKEAQLMNVQVLAFIGDSVHTLFVRSKISFNSLTKSGGLNLIQKKYLSASGQSNAILTLLSELTETELSIFKRARNYKTQSVSKNADIIEYKNATGFEALIGFLYITGQAERLQEILEKSMKISEEIK